MTGTRSPRSRGTRLSDGGRPQTLLMRVVLILTAAGAMLFAIFVVTARQVPAPDDTPDDSWDMPPAIGLAAAEAKVFRTRPSMLAVDPNSARRADAHPRTLATYRLLRSYPGAPPRVPHGLTATEFRGNRCLTCHERGGYSPRFGAYVPVTPHPEQEACLQCHATNDALVGVPFPRASPNDACRQCHSGVPARFEEAGLTWRPAPWPTLGSNAVGVVPDIPHDLAQRGNCLACHAGPGAVSAIRVSHPERASCLQCHVERGTAAAFERGAPARADRLPGATP